MTFRTRQVLVSGLCLAAAGLLVAALVRADDKKNTAVIPAVKNKERHDKFLEIAKQGNIDLVFFGDSITDGWHGREQDIWKEHYAPLNAANFGIGGDRTQHVLWRMQHGELEGYHPKVAVLMIGTNNLGSNTDEEIADGIKAIVEEIHKQQPQTKVLLLGIFPRGHEATDKNRGRIKHINEMISKLADHGKTVYYLDFGDKFLEKDGTISKDIMPDYLHLSKKGYEIWAEAIDQPLKELMK